MAEHATHFKKHLMSYSIYIKQSMATMIQKSNPFNVPGETRSDQSQLNFPRVTEQRKEHLDILAAAWCYLGNFPFNMYEHPYSKKFVNVLNPAYKAPSRKSISGPLLDSVYSMVETQTDDMIAAMPNINVITDESSNIRGSRICNISVHSSSGSIYYISEDICAKRMDVVSAAQWL
jgi:hypothetical protein